MNLILSALNLGDDMEKINELRQIIDNHKKQLQELRKIGNRSQQLTVFKRIIQLHEVLNKHLEEQVSRPDFASISSVG